jgi:putative ABC transport system ATP-binding protein
MSALVSLRDVRKTYRLDKREVAALRGVTLAIEDGEFAALAGPSGSGKTTLLNLVGCLDVASVGSVELAGLDTARLSDRRLTELRLHTIGFIFQGFNLVPTLNVYRNVELPLILQRLGNAERQRRVHSLLERVGLHTQRRQRPGELSGGQAQRVAIARALVTRPKLVLADEPTASLDSETGGDVLALMRELNRSERTTFLFSTHDPRVMEYADRLLVLRDGLMHEAEPQAAQEASA